MQRNKQDKCRIEADLTEIDFLGGREFLILSYSKSLGVPLTEFFQGYLLYGGYLDILRGICTCFGHNSIFLDYFLHKSPY